MPEPTRYIPNTLAAFLAAKFPAEMAEFDKEPWDYRLFWPSMDDLALVTVYLYVGANSCEKKIKLEYNLTTNEANSMVME